MKFEWDERKNQKNIKKHGISLEETAYIFSDLDAISIPDDEHSDEEERWITLGKIKKHGIIIVIHTERIKRDVEYIRIISARKANRCEERQYFDMSGGK